LTNRILLRLIAHHLPYVTMFRHKSIFWNTNIFPIHFLFLFIVVGNAKFYRENAAFISAVSPKLWRETKPEIKASVQFERKYSPTSLNEAEESEKVTLPISENFDPPEWTDSMHFSSGSIPTVSSSQNQGEKQVGFEGPEKTLELEFDPAIGDHRGLRAIPREQWDAVLEQAQARILLTQSNDWLDSYVLSESSLFVYPHRLVLKTCGTTTLLRCLPLLMVCTKSFGLSLEWMAYSRKDFSFPTAQNYPHNSFHQEVEFLQTMFSGSAFVHGPLNSDHWYTYVADGCERPITAALDRTLNLMMYGIDEKAATMFVKSKVIQDENDVKIAAGFDKILPNAEVHGHLFEPCGYSMNALQDESYYTMHVTPEEGVSYASFETNVRQSSYKSLIQDMLNVFKPCRFTMTLFSEKTGYEQIKENPFEAIEIPAEYGFFKRTSTTHTKFSEDFYSHMGNWVFEPSL